MSKLRFKIEVVFDDNCGNYYSKENDGYSHRTIYVCNNVSTDYTYFIKEDGTVFILDGPDNFVELFMNAFNSRNCDSNIIVYMDNDNKDGERAIVSPICFDDYPDKIKNNWLWKSL